MVKIPTGYTADVQDGKITDLKDFAAQCARGMGAFIHMRDDLGTAVLRYPEKETYHVESLAKAQKERARWDSLSEEEKYAEWSDYFERSLESQRKQAAQGALERGRYETMLGKVRSVEVPEALASFKKFMIEQLESSIEFDCSDSLISYYTPYSYVEWCNDTEATLTRRIINRNQDYIDAERRNVEKVAYIDAMAATYGFEVEK